MREHVRSGTEVFDGLRGAAILLVLCYHTWLFSWYTPAARALGIALPVDVPPRVGYLGVDLFFAISGFALFYPHALSALEGRPEQRLTDFAYRRFVKIVPSYVLALAATAYAALPLFTSTPPLLATLAQHLFFVQNFYSDAFGRANSVFWSLGIEIQFYLVFPALAWAFRRYPLLTAGGMIAIALNYRYGVAGCCLQVEVVTRQLPAFLDVFALGMLAAYAIVFARKRFAKLAAYAPAFTAAAVLSGLVVFAVMQSANAVQYDPAGRERWDLAHRTLFAGGVAAFGVLACFSQRWFRLAVANPPLVFLSTISYNLYLWHTLVMIWLVQHHVPHSTLPNPYDDPRWKAAFITLGWALSIGIATAITYFVERPLLATIKPHRFAFDWRPLRAALTRQHWSASSKRRT